MDYNAPVEPHMHRPKAGGVRESIVTQGDLQLKQLVQKQMNTDVTLSGQLSKVKNFAQGTIYSMPTDQVAGLVNPTEFSRLLQEGQRLEELRHCGLTEDEIALKLQHDTSSSKRLHASSVKERYGIDPSAHAERLTVIENKIAEKERQLLEPTTFSDAKPMSRHEMDLEQAISRDRNPSKLFSCLLTAKSSEGVDPDHPINHLDSILQDILPKLCEGKRQRRKRKRRAGQEIEIVHVEAETECCKAQSSDAGNCLDSASNLDSQDRLIPLPSDAKREIIERRLADVDYSCVESIPVEVIERYKLSTSQIRELPRFSNYHPGVPSQTLYLKNLSARVTEEDLASLFNRFQESSSQPIMFRLLHGKMKGQAFVTFSTVQSATEALNLVNGYDFKGKPIIIEFGKKTNNCSGLEVLTNSPQTGSRDCQTNPTADDAQER